MEHGRNRRLTEVRLLFRCLQDRLFPDSCSCTEEPPTEPVLDEVAVPTIAAPTFPRRAVYLALFACMRSGFTHLGSTVSILHSGRLL
jgi:hypothetical protein